MRSLIILIGLFVATRITMAEEDHGCLAAFKIVIAGDNSCHIDQSTYSCDALGFIVKSMGADPKCGLHIRVERDAQVEIAGAAVVSLHKAGFAKVQVDIAGRK
jgi:hypothetical protein